MIPAILDEILHPGNFFVAAPAELVWETAREETISWEIFHGRLLDPTHTREEATFLSWHVYWLESGQESGEPVLSLKWDQSKQQIHIVRGLLCHAWEGYQAEGNVYLSREVTKWVRELVGTVELSLFPGEEELRQELALRLFQAVVGLSRLPLTSVESPLPGFSLGQFGYFYNSARQGQTGSKEPMRTCRDLLEFGLAANLSWQEKTKLVELMLRAASSADLPELANLFARQWQKIGQTREEILRLLRTILNEVSLSPYTGFIANLLRFVSLLVEQQHLAREAHIDFLAYTLRQLGRHLTAYDLHLFHHRGANYPDALLMDAVLKEFIPLLEQYPESFLDRDSDTDPQKKQKRLRRRALRQGWLLRHFYEGLLVPDAPTSPGENLRVLPPPHVRVPEEQIVNPGKRRKQLYVNDPLEKYLGELGQQILQASIHDLQFPQEIQELGMAVFIDRPLGILKMPGEPDQTLLFSHEAFSKFLALQRLTFLQKKIPGSEKFPWHEFQNDLKNLTVTGILANRYRETKNRVVSLADANRSTDDFLLLRTTPSTVQEFLAQYPLTNWTEQFDLNFLTSENILIIPEVNTDPHAQPRIGIYDANLQKRMELAIDLSQGYTSRCGHEYPTAGLRLY